MKALEAAVRSIEQDGLVWGLSKVRRVALAAPGCLLKSVIAQLVPVGYGVSKLQINIVIEDEKVGLDELQEKIAEFEDYVQVRRVTRAA